MSADALNQIIVAPRADPQRPTLQDAPNYKPALQGILILFIILAVTTIVQAFNLIYAQKRKEKTRVRLGLPEKIADHSMAIHYEGDKGDDAGPQMEADVDQDLTDHTNPFFT